MGSVTVANPAQQPEKYAGGTADAVMAARERLGPVEQRTA